MNSILGNICYTLPISLFVFMTPLSQTGLAGPVVVGNGGDAVFCKKDADHPEFDGTYSLDYLLTFRSSNGNSDVVEPRDFESSAARIRKLLRKVPDLSYAFELFMRDLWNLDDPSRSRFWQEAAYGIIDLEDERMVRKLPPNCRSGSEQRSEIIQAVVRFERPGAIIYEFDPETLEDLRATSALQESFLLVHEWLWDVTDDPLTVRKVNRYLHSTHAEEHSKEEFRRALENFGLAASPSSFKSVCFRTPAIREFIVESMQSPCDDIEAEDLQERNTPFKNRLKLLPQDIPALRNGDFHGLSRLYSVVLSDHGINHIDEAAFLGVNSLNFLDLSNNNLKRVSPSTLDGINVKSLDFSNNKLSSFPARLFAKTYLDSPGTDTRLNLANNRIKNLPKNIEGPFGPHTYWNVIDLRNNLLEEVPDWLCNTKGAVVNLRGNPLNDEAQEKILECRSVEF